MSAFTGTRHLLRLALRLDRLRLTIWVIVLAILPAATAAQYKQLYPTQQSLDAVSGVISNVSLVAINGPLFGVSLGGLTAWKIGATLFILVAVMSILTVIRHSRTEEETGRLELLGATVVGRYAPLTAAVLTAVVANVAAAALVALGLEGAGMPTVGSWAFGLATLLTGLVFTAVGALTAQLSASARTASGTAIAVLGVAYLLRLIGDTGPTAVSWISPIGWAMRVRSYASEQWWVFGIGIVVLAVVSIVAYGLVTRRDVGAGLVPPRPGPAVAAPSLGSAFGLGWRLQRGLLLGWFIGLTAGGAVLGGAAKGISGAVIDNQKLNDMLARIGGAKGLTDAYLAACFAIVGVTAAAYTVQATVRLRGEESSGRLEPLLATRVGRVRWALSHVVFAVVGTAVLLAGAGLAGGLAYGLQIHDVGGQVGQLLGAALVQLPAAWVLAGLAVALFGLAPRLATLAWAGLVVCVLLLLVGAAVGLSQPVIDVSPFTHVPKLPGSAFTGTPMLWLTAIAAVLGAGGLLGFRRRDIG
jgi:ABC-2 type transport system permease protein